MILATTSNDSDMAVTELIIWGVIGVAFVIAIIWAIVSRIRQEKYEEKYEDRDN